MRTMSGPAVWSAKPGPTDFRAKCSLPSCMPEVSRSVSLGQSVPALAVDPVLFQLREPAEAEAGQVSEAAFAIQHQVADRVPGGRREAEADAGEGGEGDVGRA